MLLTIARASGSAYAGWSQRLAELLGCIADALCRDLSPPLSAQGGRECHAAPSGELQTQPSKFVNSGTPNVFFLLEAHNIPSSMFHNCLMNYSPAT